MHGAAIPIRTTAPCWYSGIAFSARETGPHGASTWRSVSKGVMTCPCGSCFWRPSSATVRPDVSPRQAGCRLTWSVVAIEAARTDAREILDVELGQGRPVLVIQLTERNLGSDALSIHHFPKPQLNGVAPEHQLDRPFLRCITLAHQNCQIFLVLMHVENVQPIFQVDFPAQQQPKRRTAEGDHGRPLQFAIVDHEVHAVSDQQGGLRWIVVKADATGTNQGKVALRSRAPGSGLHEAAL